MKTVRCLLSVIAGLMLGIGYAAGHGDKMWQPEKIFIGMMFAAHMIWNLLKSPEHTSSRPNLIVIALLLSALNVWAAVDDTRLELIWTLAWTFLFSAAYFSAAWIYHREQETSNNDNAIADP